jgi:glycosyltransferase involved in cell wall biosynthesis
MVFVQDERTMKQLLALRCPAKLLPSGVDLEKFKPVRPEKKIELRTKYGLNREAFTVLHVGHITKERNVELLTQVRSEHAAQVVLVGSNLPHKDRPALTAQLREQGIIVFDTYIRNVEELYQLSDCYLFPVFSDQACIGTPLSVLEAMACNLPVITVRYGGLPILFKEGDGFFFADTTQDLIQGIARVRNFDGCRTRQKVTPYSWENVTEELLEFSGVNEERR